MDAGPLDYLIIGAGPAGLQLAQELGAAGHDYLVLESAKIPGMFFTRFPRHRQLISINKRHTGTDDPELNLRMDWNSLLSPDENLLFTRYSERYFPAADDLVRYLADYAARFGLRIEYDTTATRVSRTDDGLFAVADSRGRVHLADPLRGAPARGEQQLPGHLPAQVAERDPRRHGGVDRPGRRRAVHGALLVLARQRDGQGTALPPRHRVHGFRFDAEIFDDSCRPALVHKDRFPRITSAYEAEGVPGLYVVGTITQPPTCIRSSGCTGGPIWWPRITWPRTWRTSGTSRRTVIR